MSAVRSFASRTGPWLMGAVIAAAAGGALACSGLADELGSASDEQGAADVTGSADLALSSPVYGQVTYIGDIPSNKQTEWFDHAQGIAAGLYAGQVVTFFSTNSTIFGREVASSSLFGVAKNEPKPWKAGIPPSLSRLGYDHFGDLDLQVDATAAGDDLLYVPVEKSDKSILPVVAVFRVNPTTLSFVTSSVLSTNGSKEAPWIAVLPSDPSKIYTSGFAIGPTTSPPGVLLYEDIDSGPSITLGVHRTLKLLTRDFGAELTLNEVQGGEFNRNGRLFLLAERGPEGPGIYGFTQTTAPSTSPFSGQRVLQQFDYYPATITAGRNEEFEGITLGLIAPPEASSASHVHAVLNQDGDTFYKHWRVSQNTSHFAL